MQPRMVSDGNVIEKPVVEPECTLRGLANNVPDLLAPHQVFNPHEPGLSARSPRDLAADFDHRGQLTVDGQRIDSQMTKTPNKIYPCVKGLGISRS